ncbi:inverse autotransporter beta domain-containing protein [Pseudothauera rhizosphaerae]|nr:inverse autotransporter beta domain-containing protein [Pseudothauera rhizosphaerae]
MNHTYKLTRNTATGQMQAVPETAKSHGRGGSGAARNPALKTAVGTVLTVFALGAAATEAPKWGPHIDLEAKPGNRRTLREADLFVPVWQNADTLLFANLRGRFDNRHSREGNLGLGLRRMLDSGWNVGIYGYLDRRRTEFDNHFNQATAGFEALGPDWDFRANVYRPTGDKARELNTVGGGASTAALSGTTITVTTPGSTAYEERALKGYDAEIGWRVPLFETEGARQLRLHAGGYRFSDAGTTVSGPRIRVELAIEDLAWFGNGTALFLGAEAQKDDERGSQNFLSLRLRIPLDKETSRPAQRSMQERRMTAPVVRDVDIVAQRRVSRVMPTLVESVDAATPTPAVTTASGRTVTLLSSETTAGNQLQAVFDAAGNDSTVVLAGDFYTGATALHNGQSLLGSTALTVTTASGRRATVTTPAAAINAFVIGSTTPAVSTAAPGSSLSGVTVNRTDITDPASGVTLTMAGGTPVTLLSSETTTGANLQAALNAAGSGSTVVLAGTFNTNTTVAVQAGQSLLGAGDLTVTTASGHTATIAAPGATLDVTTGSTTLFGVTMENGAVLSGLTIVATWSGGGTPTAVTAQGSSNVTITDNTIVATSSSFGAWGVDARRTTDTVIRGNTITAQGGTGAGIAIMADGVSAGAATVNLTVADNTIDAVGGFSGNAVFGNAFTGFAAGSTGNTAIHGTCTFTGTPSGAVGFTNISCP